MGTVLEKPSSSGVSPALIYLDLNKWIDLARAESANSDGDRCGLPLDTAKELVSKKNAIFPLSAAHFMEVAKIGDDSRRRKLAKLMVKLSDGWLLASQSYLLMPALRRAVALQFGLPFQHKGVALLSRSLESAFTSPKHPYNDNLGKSVVRSPGILEEILATARVRRDFVDRWTSYAAGHEAARARGWGVSRQIRKRAYCARVVLGISDRLLTVLTEFGLAMEDLERLGPNAAVEFLELVPFFDVEINLHVERNEHRDRKIATNDEIDLGFLSVAVPYCQVVVTERFWTALVHRTQLDRKYDTLVTHDLNEALLSVRAI